MSEPTADQPDATGSSESVARLERELGVLARRRLRALARRGLESRTIDGTGYGVLCRLEERGPMRLTALARLMRLDASTVSRQVAAMTAAGLLERESDPSDRRAYLICPTDAGRDQLVQVQRARCAVLRDLLSAWSDEDRSSLAELVGRLNAELDRLTAPGDDDEQDDSFPVISETA